MATYTLPPTNAQAEPTGAIVRQVLLDASLGTLPTTPPGSWPIYVANEPDKPDECITVFATTGVRQGRYMVGGAYVWRRGFNIRVRALDYLSGRTKAIALTNFLTVTYKSNTDTDPLLVDTTEYALSPFKITSGPIDLGKSLEDSRRYLFSINGTVIFTELDSGT